MASSKGIKSSLKSIYTIFILAIFLLTMYFLIDSRVRSIIQQSDETGRINNTVRSFVTQHILTDPKQWSAALDSISQGKTHPALEKFREILVVADASDDGVNEVFLLRKADSISYKLLSSKLPLGQIESFRLGSPQFTITKDTAMELDPSINIGTADEVIGGIDVSTSAITDLEQLEETIHDDDGTPICAVMVNIDQQSFLSTLKENLIGNLLSVFILVTLTLVLTSFMFRRIIRKEESIKDELSSVNILLEEKNTEIVDSINYAKRIQDAYLPDTKVLHYIFPESFILFKPKDVVSGDFYWFFTVANANDNAHREAYIAVADCTGHGVPGAIMSVICCNALNEAAVNRGLSDVGAILDFTREQVIKNLKSRTESDTKDGMDIALCKINRNTLEVEYAGANNPLWIVSDKTIEGCDSETTVEGIDKVLSEFKASKQPIGMYAAMKPFVTKKLHLQKGDSIYLSSDGFPDQFGGERGKKLKSVNLKKKLLRLSDTPMEAQIGMLLKQFDEWKGELDQIDDVCVMGVQV